MQKKYRYSDKRRRLGFRGLEPELLVDRFFSHCRLSVPRLRSISFYHLLLLQGYPKSVTSLTRIRNRCTLSGQGRSVFRFFHLSRRFLRERIRSGLLPGIRISSWLISFFKFYFFCFGGMYTKKPASFSIDAVSSLVSSLNIAIASRRRIALFPVSSFALSISKFLYSKGFLSSYSIKKCRSGLHIVAHLRRNFHGRPPLSKKLVLFGSGAHPVFFSPSSHSFKFRTLRLSSERVAISTSRGILTLSEAFFLKLGGRLLFSFLFQFDFFIIPSC